MFSDRAMICLKDGSHLRCAVLVQTPDPDNKYGPNFRFGNRPYAYNPLQYIPNSNVHCMDDGSFPL